MSYRTRFPAKAVFRHEPPRAVCKGTLPLILTIILSLFLSMSPLVVAQDVVDPASTVLPVSEPPAEIVIPTEEQVPTAVPTAVPTLVPTGVPTAVQTAVPTLAPTAVPTQVLPTAVPPTLAPTVMPTSAPTNTPAPTSTVAPTPTTTPRLIAPASIGPGTGVVTGCTQNGSDVLQPGGTLSATCSFTRPNNHTAVFTIGAPSGAGWQVQVSSGGTSSSLSPYPVTYTAPLEVNTFTVLLTAPDSGGVPGAMVTSLISLQTCNQGGQQCATGSTTISASLSTVDLSKVTMTCDPASPLSIVRTGRGTLGCTVRNSGTTSVMLRSVRVPAPSAGWSVTTTPVASPAPDGSVTISPNQILATGQTWTFSLALAPACTAVSNGSWSITSRIAPMSGSTAGPEVGGPGVTYAANTSNPAQTVTTSLVSTSLRWLFTASFEEQTAVGALTYRVTGAGCSGWSTSVSAGPFTYTGTARSSEIPANSLVMTNMTAPTVISGSGTGVAGTAQTGGLGTTRKLISASPGSGNGTYEQQLEITMTLPAGSTVGTYKSTITITTAAAP
jgi:hypothetical protein